MRVLLKNKPNAPISSIAGFPAVETNSTYLPRDSECIYVIDVADEQALVARYYANGGKTTREQACQKARTAAEFAMQTLIRQAGG